MRYHLHTIAFFFTNCIKRYELKFLVNLTITPFEKTVIIFLLNFRKPLRDSLTFRQKSDGEYEIYTLFTSLLNLAAFTWFCVILFLMFFWLYVYVIKVFENMYCKVT